MSHLPLPLASMLLAVLTFTPSLSAQEKPTSPPAVDLGAAEVQFLDNSTMKLSVRQEKLEVATPYGKLVIPVADILRIEFGLRVPPDLSRRIDTALAGLASSQFRQREAAAAELLKCGPKAYSALAKAAKVDDAEVARRVEAIIEKLKEEFGDDQLDLPEYDTIYTESSKIAGRIEGLDAWKVATTQFGEVSVKLADLRTVRFVSRDGGEAAANAVADPGDLRNVHQNVGKLYAYRVTGAKGGPVWGTDIYTADSLLAAAAVHAGLLKVGQTGVVRVKILGPQPAFQGSNRNGITSMPFGLCPAFQFQK